MTEIPVLAAFVLQIQMTKLALCPALTCEEEDKDWTRTHSCGVLWPGAGEVGLPLGEGVGVGVGDGALVVGSGLGLGDVLAELSVADELGVVLEVALPDGAGEDVSGADGLALDEGSVLGDTLPRADGDVELVL